MSFNDSLSDMLTRIRNAHRVNKSITHCFSSNLNNNVLKVLKDEGYIRDYKNVEVRVGIRKIKIELKWNITNIEFYIKIYLSYIKYHILYSPVLSRP